MAQSYTEQGDRELLWHPFTQHAVDAPPVAMVRGEGAYLYSEQGERWIDASGSWWATLHGHAHPVLAAALARQAAKLEHLLFADYTHAPAVELARRLLPLLPRGLQRFFYSDNGSTAVEVGLKMALQYWHNGDVATRRTRIVALRGGYHGDTFAAMATAGRAAVHRPFWPFLFEVDLIDPPFQGQEGRSLGQLEALLERGDVACFLYEPLIQGLNGIMRLHAAEGLNQLLERCHASEVLCIADEAMTGFGRTGRLFASEYMAEPPDILCLAKGLSGGTVPLALTVCKEAIYEKFLSHERSKALLHGHTFTANPLGCAAGLASLELLLGEDSLRRRRWLEAKHAAFCKEYGALWRRCEALGTILVVEYGEGDYFTAQRDLLARHFATRRIMVRPFGSVVAIAPPYLIEEEALEALYEALLESVPCMQSR